ncbi:MAG TPA: HNH endonuclease signature motif containing protein [Polyangiaceae bacterium]|nr:HNH endonuclease signature motif containing protein [Polyangiaceae bacterium]
MGAHSARALEEGLLTWQLAHAALSRLARERAAADAEEGRWLLAARRAAAHVHLGFGSFAEYIERLFGYQPRSTQEKLRVAEALEELPALERALSQGELSWSAVRELTRVVASETEQQWLELARGKTLRQLEELLAGRHHGDEPSASPDRSVQRHVLRFEVAAETFALFRDALRELQRRSGAGLDDDAALLELARGVLAGPRDEGRASYQVVLEVCPVCGGSRQHAEGALVPVGPEVVAMACCDGQHLGQLNPSGATPANDRDASPASAGASVHEGTTTAAPTRAVAGSTHVGSPAIASRNAHVGVRAKQSIPPALRRSVLLRDQRRCQVPGCRNTRYLDLHHLQLRSEGGAHSADNLVCLCGTHHRAAHRGAISLHRDDDGALQARHADGSKYGQAAQPQALETHTKVFSALRNLGFREREVRTVLGALRTTGSVQEITFDRLLRDALARLRPRRQRE